MRRSSALRELTSSAAILSTFCIVGCVSVSSGPVPALEVAPRPLFESVSIDGLKFRDERVSGREEGAAWGAAWSGAGSAHGVARYGAVTYEHYDNTELQKVLRTALEDYRVARKIRPGANARIEGAIIASGSTTGAGRIVWNTLNTISFLWLFGIPYLGSWSSDVELRIYESDELLGKVVGHGSADWVAGFDPLRTIPRGRRDASILASAVAVRDAIAVLATRTPHAFARLPSTNQPNASATRPSEFCSHKWDGDGREVARCQRSERNAYERLGPVISRMQDRPSTPEARRFKACYAQWQSASGTDWMMTERCFASTPAALFR